jgi:hypothetical protein
MSINCSGLPFISGTGRSYTLNDGTYSINTIQIRRTDDVSNVSKNTSPIVIDTTDPILDSQPTTVDTHVNAPIATTVYDAQVTNLSSGNADKGITPVSLKVKLSLSSTLSPSPSPSLPLLLAITPLYLA